MPEDIENETTLQVQGMRPLPTEQSLEAVDQPAAQPEQSPTPRRRGPGRPKASASTARRAREAKGSSTESETSRGPVKSRRGRPAERADDQNSATQVSTLDEFEELARLDKENRQLRKTLGEKLRRENADLRKRLRLE